MPSTELTTRRGPAALIAARGKSALRIFKEAGLAWINSDVFRLSASLSYFTIFSLAPLLIIVLFVVGLFWSGQTGSVQARILSEIGNLTGPSGAEMVGTMLENAERPGSGGIIATIFGVGALLFGATAVFVQLKGALNTIWEIEPEALGIKGFLLSRVLSFGLVLGVGFLLLVSLVVSAALAAADELILGLSPELHVFMRALNMLVAFTVVSALFAMMYRFLPDVDLAWRDVWIGAVMTALLFTLGKFLITMYLGNSTVTSTYGAAGSLAVLLLWVYYSALVFFFGAELTQAYVRRYGRRKAFGVRSASSVPEKSASGERVDGADPEAAAIRRGTAAGDPLHAVGIEGAGPERSAAAISRHRRAPLRKHRRLHAVLLVLVGLILGRTIGR